MDRPATATRDSRSGAPEWPDSLVKLVGSWADDDFPSHEEIRAGIGEDLPREPF
jgi:hypothetical protein